MLQLFLRFSLLFVLHISFLCGYNLENKYPSYVYVFNEFDIDTSYINDVDFKIFVHKHEKNLYHFYKQSLIRGKEVLPTMKSLLVGEGVSDLFIYLSMIESGFSSSAISPKQAAGLWQFMPATAKHYNLSVGQTYDERFDASLSTSAAIHYLNKLHKQFGKWYLAAMAYNCGEGCLEKAIKHAGTDDLSILTDDRLKYLPKETREYIKKILLIAMIGENNILEYSKNSDTIEVEVKAGANLENIALQLKMPYKTLKKLNLKLKDARIPQGKKKYTIRIPIDKVFAFYLHYDLEYSEKIDKPYMIAHNVELGETLVSIAAKYHTSSMEIIDINNLKNEYLTLGQFLVIPVDKNTFEKHS